MCLTLLAPTTDANQEMVDSESLILFSLAEILAQDLANLQGYGVLLVLHQKLELNLLERVMNHMILHHDHA